MCITMPSFQDVIVDGDECIWVQKVFFSSLGITTTKVAELLSVKRARAVVIS